MECEGMNREYTGKINGLENREKFTKYVLDIATQERLELEQVNGNGSNEPLD